MAMRMKPTAVKAQAAPAVRAVKAAVPPAKWAPAGLLAAATLAQAAPAKAVETEIDSSVEAVIGAVKSAGELVKSGITTVDSGIKLLQQGYEAASPVFDQGVKAVSPIVQQAAKATAEAASPALSAALPAFSDAQKAVEATLKDSSISSVVDTTKGAITVATPIAAQIAKFLTTTEPVLLAEYGAGALAFFYLAPALLGGLGSAFKGYAGEITAAQVLDALTDGNSALVDIRTQKEKESSGVPDVPSSLSNRLVEVEFAVTEDKKLRNALRDPNSIEAAVTSMQIASLKRVNKGTKIILLDRYGNASTVAKELASKGFGKVYTVQGGFDGRNGWVQSKLQIKPAASVINAPLPFLGTRGATGTKKALPAPKA